MADNVTTLVFRGRLQYAKVLGEPVLNYNKDGQEWKFDFIPNDAAGAAKELKAAGVRDRLRSLKDADDKPRYDGAEYMSFKQNATKRNGEPNTPIRVVDVLGKAWPQDVNLGNDTIADVKFVVIDNGKGRFHGVYPRSIRVLEHVPYEKKEFDDIDENDEYYQAAVAAEEQKRKDMNALTGGSVDFDDDIGDLGA